MAKRKDSVALFEVITAAKRKEAAAAARRAAMAASLTSQPPSAAAPAPSVLRTPKWWFKSKKSGAAGHVASGYAAPALPAPAEHDPTELAPAVPAGFDPTSSAPAPTPGVVQRVVPPTSYTSVPERVTIPAAASSEHPGLTVDPFGLDIPTAKTDPTYPARPRRNWLASFGGRGRGKLDVDPDRREVTVRFRYTTAIIVGFALCVAVGLAYISGRRSNRASAGAAGVSSEQVRRGPILAGVLTIPQADRTLARNNGDDDAVEQPAPRGVGQASKEQSKPATPPTPTPTTPQSKPGAKLPGEAAGVSTGLPRSIGLNYVVVQSYSDHKTAEEARKALEAAGVPCTIEEGLKDWAPPTMFCVVGTHGFSSVKTSAAYRQYEDAIRNVSKSFAGTSKYKMFDPRAYKWKPQPN
jgi:hypothetical protein